MTLLFVTPSPCEALASSRVDACIGASDPNDFTVRCSPFVSRAAASTAPCPSFATTANAPLVGQDGNFVGVIPPALKAEYFHAESLTNIWGDLPVGQGKEP